MADEIIAVRCAKCQFEIHMKKSVNDFLRSNGQSFYCLSGHSNVYGAPDSNEAKLRKQLEEERRQRQRAEQNVAMWADDAKTARETAERERRRANGYKGHATRITKRAKAGVCPCCNRTFKQLAAHMATQHPQFTPDCPEPARETVR